jgi:hypothetical protein
VRGSLRPQGSLRKDDVVATALWAVSNLSPGDGLPPQLRDR